MTNENYWNLFYFTEQLLNDTNVVNKKEILNPYKYIILSQLVEKDIILVTELEGLFYKYIGQEDNNTLFSTTLEELDSDLFVEYKGNCTEIKISSLGKEYFEEKQNNIKIREFYDSIDYVIDSISKFLLDSSVVKNKEALITKEIVQNMLLKFIQAHSNNLMLEESITSSADAIAIFYLWAKVNDSKAYQIICSLATSSTLLLIWDTPREVINTLHNTSFYLDTTFLFELAGTHSEEAKEIALKIINFIKGKKGKIKIFEKTHTEITKIINSSKQIYNSSYYDASIANELTKYFRYNQEEFFDKNQVELWHKKFENLLFIEYNIQIDKTNYYDASYKTYQIDEKELTDFLTLKRSNAEKQAVKDSILFDVSNIASIYKLRKDDGVPSFNTWKEVPAVFITKNKSMLEGCKQIRMSVKNHRIPPILLQAKMLYIISGTNTKKFYETMNIELLSYAHSLVVNSTAKIQKHIKNKRAKINLDNDNNNLVLEMLVEKINTELIIANTFEECPDLIDTNDLITSIEKVNTALQAEHNLAEIREKNTILRIEASEERHKRIETESILKEEKSIKDELISENAELTTTKEKNIAFMSIIKKIENFKLKRNKTLKHLIKLLALPILFLSFILLIQFNLISVVFIDNFISTLLVNINSYLFSKLTAQTSSFVILLIIYATKRISLKTIVNVIKDYLRLSKELKILEREKLTYLNEDSELE